MNDSERYTALLTLLQYFFNYWVGPLKYIAGSAFRTWSTIWRCPLVLFLWCDRFQLICPYTGWLISLAVAQVIDVQEKNRQNGRASIHRGKEKWLETRKGMHEMALWAPRSSSQSVLWRHQESSGVKTDHLGQQMLLLPRCVIIHSNACVMMGDIFHLRMNESIYPNLHRKRNRTLINMDVGPWC